MLQLLLALQVFHVAFLLLHDWIPMGRLSNPAATRLEHSTAKVLLGSLISTLPFAIALGFSLEDQHRRYPHWLLIYLWIAYALLFVGELRAWWFPYFRGAKPDMVQSYARMFGETHAFLPARNGIRINTLHCVLHLLTLTTLITLGALTL
jgi:hypothetical protein